MSRRLRARRLRRRAAGLLGLLVAAALLYLLFWPVPIHPEPWRPPAPSDRFGPDPTGDGLAALRRIPLGGARGPEDIAFDAQGRLYTGVADGRILRLRPDGSGLETFARTGGRPLGLDFAPDGELLVADARRGLLAVAPDGGVTALSAKGAGVRVAAANDLHVAPDGTVYFTSSTGPRFDPHRRRNILEHRPLGRLWAYDPSTGSTRLVLDSLYFANGVLASPDGASVLVVETASYRVLRVWVDGDRAGRSEVFAENLPGFPDGISRSPDGTLWLALVSPRMPLLDALMPHPFLRKALWRIPEILRPRPPRRGLVLGLDAAGRPLHELRDPSGAYVAITHVVEREGRLYTGSLVEDAIGGLPVP